MTGSVMTVWIPYLVGIDFSGPYVQMVATAKVEGRYLMKRLTLRKWIKKAG